VEIGRHSASWPPPKSIASQRRLYPNSLASKIKVWFIDVGGTVLVIHTDQTGPNPEIKQEIQQVVESIRFQWLDPIRRSRRIPRPPSRRASGDGTPSHANQPGGARANARESPAPSAVSSAGGRP
jgi:hypothetical protein